MPLLAFYTQMVVLKRRWTNYDLGGKLQIVLFQAVHHEV